MRDLDSQPKVEIREGNNLKTLDGGSCLASVSDPSRPSRGLQQIRYADGS